MEENEHNNMKKKKLRRTAALSLHDFNSFLQNVKYFQKFMAVRSIEEPRQFYLNM